MFTLPTSERGPPRSSAAATYASEASRRAEPNTSAVVVPCRSMSSTAARYTGGAVPPLSDDSAGNAYLARKPSSAMSGRSMPVPMYAHCATCTWQSTKPGSRNSRGPSRTNSTVRDSAARASSAAAALAASASRCTETILPLVREMTISAGVSSPRTTPSLGASTKFPKIASILFP